MPDDFQALVLRQQDQHTSAAIERLQLSDLPAQEVLVKVDYSSCLQLQERLPDNASCSAMTNAPNSRRATSSHARSTLK